MYFSTIGGGKGMPLAGSIYILLKNLNLPKIPILEIKKKYSTKSPIYGTLKSKYIACEYDLVFQLFDSRKSCNQIIQNELKQQAKKDEIYKVMFSLFLLTLFSSGKLLNNVKNVEDLKSMLIDLTLKFDRNYASISTDFFLLIKKPNIVQNLNLENMKKESLFTILGSKWVQRLEEKKIKKLEETFYKDLFLIKFPEEKEIIKDNFLYPSFSDAFEFLDKAFKNPFFGFDNFFVDFIDKNANFLNNSKRKVSWSEFIIPFSSKEYYEFEIHEIFVYFFWEYAFKNNSFRDLFLKDLLVKDFFLKDLLAKKISVKGLKTVETLNLLYSLQTNFVCLHTLTFMDKMIIDYIIDKNILDNNLVENLRKYQNKKTQNEKTQNETNAE